MSLVDDIRPLAIRGMLPREIADCLGISRGYARAAVSRLRARGEPIIYHRLGPDPTTGIAARMREIKTVRAYLQREARRRNVSVTVLRRRLLLAIAADDMVDAVLDDGGAE